MKQTTERVITALAKCNPTGDQTFRELLRVIGLEDEELARGLMEHLAEAAIKALTPDEKGEPLELRLLTDEEQDECSFYVDSLPDGRSLTQHRCYRWGDTAIIAVGELNQPNNWDDEDFDHTCVSIETALSEWRN